MTISLEEIAAAIDTVTITLGTREVQARLLSCEQEKAIRATLKRPIAPFGRPPNMGSAAPEVQRFDDPGYVEELLVYNIDRELLYIAVAIGFVTADGLAFNQADQGATLKWSDATRSELRAVLGDDHIVCAYEKMISSVYKPEREKSLEKSSSSPGGDSPTPRT